jgi:hypothetical protein
MKIWDYVHHPMDSKIDKSPNGLGLFLRGVHREYGGAHPGSLVSYSVRADNEEWDLLNPNLASFYDLRGRVFPGESLPSPRQFRQPILQPDEALKQENRSRKSDQSRQEYEYPDALSPRRSGRKELTSVSQLESAPVVPPPDLSNSLPRRLREAHSGLVVLAGGHPNSIVLDRKRTFSTR